MKKFAIIGVSGYIAKKHVKCIKELKGDLVAAMDLHDNVGYLDSFFPNCKFFNNEKKFFSFIRKKKLDFVVVCTPSYKHFDHIKKSIKSYCNVIVEKPPLLRESQFKKIYDLEKTYKKNCFCVFQLRFDKRLINLRNKIKSSKKINDVKINYFTYRGDWYFNSWKNNKNKSGGLLINIGIHFFDILFWIFGKSKKILISKRNKETIIGEIILDKARVKWVLSVKNLNRNIKNNKASRSMTVNNKKFNFDKFDDLHKINYREIILNNGHKLENFKYLIKTISKI